MATKLKALTPQESAFVREFLRDPRGKAAAAERAGYKCPGVAASKLLAKPHVKAALDEYYQRTEPQEKVDRERVRRRMLASALADPSLAYDDDWSLRPRHEIPASTRRLILSAKRWEGVDGTSTSARMSDPGIHQARYLKAFPPPEEKEAGDLEEARSEFMESCEELLARLEEDALEVGSGGDS